MALFENYEGRMPQLQPVLEKYGFANFDEVKAYTNSMGVDAYSIVESTQPICFENVKWAYELGAAIAMKKNAETAAKAAEYIGEALQAFCIPGSVADQRQVGYGHGNLGAMLLDENTECFAFLAGHESFAAAEGAIKIALNANKVRQKPLRVILCGLGKDAAMIISRINGFTYVQTKYDYLSADVKEDHALTIVSRTPYSTGDRAKVNCYGADDVREGVAIMWHENADVSITGRHLQEGAHRGWQEVLLRRLRRRHRPYPASGQHGGRPGFLRHDRHHGPHAQRRPVCGQLLRPGARRDDGLPGRGQQSDGWHDRRGGRCGGAGAEEVISGKIPA